MRRLLTSLPVLALASSALAVLGPASPAGADTNACVGQGTATTGALVYPVTVSTAPMVTVTQPRTVGFGFSLDTGTCAPDLGKHLTATGTVRGWCGLSSGLGLTGQGNRFNWIAVGGVAVVTGGLTGTAVVTPNVLVAGNSCNTGATSFSLTLAVALTECLTMKTKGLTDVGPLPPTLTTTPPLSVHTGPWGFHWKLCG